MSILAVDVQYQKDENATAMVAGILVADWSTTVIQEAHLFDRTGVAAYEPGAFYKRELPCILVMLDHLRVKPDIIIVDGYVDLAADGAEPHPGLGRHLYNALGGRVAVVGVAKTAFKDAPHAEVHRGKDAKNPLYVTAAGMPLEEAVKGVLAMAGPYRIPTLLKTVDGMVRGH